MTPADLPPQWVPVNLVQLSESERRHVQAYAAEFAKLAVRQALERAENNTMVYELHDGSIVKVIPVLAIRAIIKEYE